jgi:hypothetical protein
MKTKKRKPFLSEKEAKKIIKQNMPAIFRKIQCASSGSTSCASPGAVDVDPPCGCCGVPG